MGTKIKVSTPKDLEFIDIDTVIEKFEEELQKVSKGHDYYHVVITGEYPRNVLNKIQRIYLDAGWRAVDCKTSTENGERGGLTGLQLYR